MRLTVFGAGYVGLVSGVGLSDLGHEVCIVDIDPTRIARLDQGDVPIYEPGLTDLLKRGQQSGRLRFATSLDARASEADAYFVAVGTPSRPDGSADVDAVFACASQIASSAKKSALVVVKSTVPVGTCDAVQAHLGGRSAVGVELEVVSNPEFLKEGDAVNDFLRPERIVLGARSEHAQNMLRELYAPLQLSGERLVITDPRSSELVKYASNAMLAMRVSFMNELSRLCHASGADIHSVRLGMGTDSRIGKRFLYAGPGYGGSCFPKDVQALYHLGQSHGVPMRLAEATHRANEEQTQFLVELVSRSVGSPRGKTFALWGLAFKPETDDVREAPAIKLARALIEAGAKVVGHDPIARQSFLTAMGGETESLRVTERDFEALDGAHCLVLLTEWRSYRAPDFAEVRRRLVSDGEQAPVLVDARNVWRPIDVQRAGLRYLGVGVPSTGSTGALPPASSPALGVASSRRGGMTP